MRNFLKSYYLTILFALPIILVLGSTLPLLGLIAISVVGLLLATSKDRGALLIFFLIILVLGDSRDSWLEFVKPARAIVLIIVSITTIQDIRFRRIPFQPPFLSLLPFILLSLIPLVLVSPQKSIAFQKTLSYFLVVFVAFHAYSYRLKQGVEKLEELLHFAAFVMFLGLVLHFAVPGIELALGNRYYGVFGNPNGMGLFALLIFPFWLIHRRSRSKSSSLKSGLYLFLLIFSLILSGSRNSLFGLVAYIFLTWWLSSKRKRALFFFGVLPGIYLFFTNVDIPSFLQALGLGETLRADSIADGSGRLLSWTFALERIPDHLWLGGGFSYQEYVYDYQVPEALQIFRQMSSTWNSYLTLLLNNGILGTIMFLLFVFAQVWYAPKDRRWDHFAFVFGMLVAAIYETWLTASINSFTIYFLIGLSYLNVVQPHTPNAAISD